MCGSEATEGQLTIVILNCSWSMLFFLSQHYCILNPDLFLSQQEVSWLEIENVNQTWQLASWHIKVLLFNKKYIIVGKSDSVTTTFIEHLCATYVLKSFMHVNFHATFIIIFPYYRRRNGILHTCCYFPKGTQ